MKAIDRQFTKIINGTTQFVIPVFQRDYSWTEEQCEQLWRDILRVADGDSEAAHFLGSVVYTPTGDSAAGFTRWLMIDGQQRVTTLTLLLVALRDHIQETGWEGDDDGPTAGRIDAYFLKNTHEHGDREKKLVLRRRDQETLAALIDRKELPDPPSERIRDNYEFFREQLQEVDPARVYRGIGRLVVVDVTLDSRTDDPQLVFESLNSTGVDLSQADLIRNFILMRLKEREQTRIYEEYWSKIEGLFRGSEKAFDAFARDFMALKTRASKQEKAEDIYRAFRQFFPDWQQKVGGLEAALEEVLRFARYYAAFSNGVGGPATLRPSLDRLRSLVDVPAILIMRLFDCHERVGSLSVDEFAEALCLIESYIFRRAICGLQTRGYWQVFANISYRLSDAQPLQDLKVAFARQSDSYRFPSDEAFRKALLERDLYGLRVCRHLLEGLENHGTREPTDTSAYSIEHIMPQNETLPAAWRTMLGDDWKRVHQTWLHRLGNLTLTGYNSKYSDRPFEEKMSIPGGFKDSAVRLNRVVAEQSQWTESEMARRGQELAKRALMVWPPLQVSEEAIRAAERRDLREKASRSDVTKVRMSAKARKLFSDLRDLVRDLDSNVIEVAESRSVSYYGPEFFLEVLPRKHRITLLLPLDFHEVSDPHGLAEDATQWKFLFYAQHEGGVALRIQTTEDIAYALPIIQQARSLAAI